MLGQDVAVFRDCRSTSTMLSAWHQTFMACSDCTCLLNQLISHAIGHLHWQPFTGEIALAHTYSHQSGVDNIPSQQ